MKAVVYTRYGGPDVLEVADVEKPVPRNDEVLVRLRAVSLNASDWEGLTGKPLYARIMGLFRPRRHVLGSDISGTVEAVGPDASRFQPGDDVFADTLGHLGGFAEYVCVPEKILAPLPDGMSHEDAAALPQAGAIAWQGIVAKGRVQPGHAVLVNGAGGGSGMYAIQLAKLHGAEVTAVDNSEKLEFMRSLAADHVIDYTQEDFSRNGRTYDLILDLVGQRSVFAYRHSLKPGGRAFYVGGSMRALFQVLLIGPLIGRIRRKKVRVLMVKLGVQHLAPMIELCQADTISTHIDRRYRLPQVPEALAYLGDGHARGKLLVVSD